MKTRPKPLFMGFIVTVLLTGTTAWAAESEPITNDDCLSCHDSFKHQNFSASVHGQQECVDCHAEIRELPHPEKLKPVRCGDCHEEEQKLYASSDHGQRTLAGTEASACLSCHGDSHAILPVQNPLSPVHKSNVHKTCAVCHEDQARMEQYGLSKEKPVTSYLETVHGKAIQKGLLDAAVCTDCHGAHDIQVSNNPGSKTHWRNVPKTCGKCHAEILRAYDRSVHAKALRDGERDAPVCTDCHGEHTILAHTDPQSSVHAKNVSEKTCAACHAAERIAAKYNIPSNRYKTYLNSYHGLANKMGVTTVANCASCHGAHNILPSKDPASPVHKSNLAKTCGQCHANAGDQLASASVHSQPSAHEDKVVYYVTLFYIGLIFIVVGGMIFHNVIDFGAHIKAHYKKRKAEAVHERFSRSEVIQHLVLFGSFTILAYSGFALKFSDAWWAAPFSWFGAQYDLRGIVHRIAAVVFTVLGIYHVIYALVTAQGRSQLKKILPKFKDWEDFKGQVLFNLGRADKRPRFHKFSYVEKAEYWALIWGSIVMVVTGGALAFENISLQFFPKWVLDVSTAVHYYEAILATSAIVVWHFYFTIFHPEHYPMNWSMTTGKTHEKEHEEEPPKKTRTNPKNDF